MAFNSYIILFTAFTLLPLLFTFIFTMPRAKKRKFNDSDLQHVTYKDQELDLTASEKKLIYSNGTLYF